MSKGIRNIAASVRQKLKNKAAQDNRPFAELLQYYAMERFLYRLTQSEYAGLFILKGALMLRAWKSPEIRPTMDIDMLGITSNEVNSICDQITDIIAIDTDDGLAFDPATIRGEIIKEDADYEGVRVRFIGRLDWIMLVSLCKLMWASAILYTLNLLKWNCPIYWILLHPDYFAIAVKVP